MAGSLNRAQLIGHLGADPEIRRTQDGKPIANFRIATSESWKDKETGERKERTEWHAIVVFSEGIAGVVEKYLRKGSKVFVEGRLQTREWEDKEGVRRWTTEVVVNVDGRLILLDKAEGGGRPPPVEGPDDYGQGKTRERSSAADDYRTAKSGDPQSRPRPVQTQDFDDDIPF